MSTSREPRNLRQFALPAAAFFLGSLGLVPAPAFGETGPARALASRVVRVAGARAYCLDLARTAPPAVSFKIPTDRDYATMYTEGVGGLLHPLHERFWADWATTSAASSSTLEALGSRYRKYVSGPAAHWNEFQKICMAGCLASELLVPLPETPGVFESLTTEVEEVIRDGRGKCLHFAAAGKELLRLAGYPARLKTGRNHAFLEVEVGGRPYYFDPQHDGRTFCNFMPVDEMSERYAGATARPGKPTGSSDILSGAMGVGRLPRSAAPAR